jgi:hypothetical protein
MKHTEVHSWLNSICTFRRSQVKTWFIRFLGARWQWRGGVKISAGPIRPKNRPPAWFADSPDFPVYPPRFSLRQRAKRMGFVGKLGAVFGETGGRFSDKRAPCVLRPREKSYGTKPSRTQKPDEPKTLSVLVYAAMATVRLTLAELGRTLACQRTAKGIEP